MRAVERAAGGGVARAVVLQQSAVAVLDLDRAVHAAAVSPSSRRARSRRREIPAPAPRGGARAGSRLTVSARAAATATAISAVSCSTASSQCGSLRGVFQQAVARAQRSLERSDAAGMLRIDREHQAIEETAALGGRAVEQRVHGRHQPHHAQVVGEGRRRGHRFAVDAAFARRAPNPRRPADRCRCRAWPGPACLRSRPTPPRRRRLRKTRVPPWWRGASRGPAPAAKWLRSDWSCRRRWRRSAPPVRPRRARPSRRDSCGNWSASGGG